MCGVLTYSIFYIKCHKFHVLVSIPICFCTYSTFSCLVLIKVSGKHPYLTEVHSFLASHHFYPKLPENFLQHSFKPTLATIIRCKSRKRDGEESKNSNGKNKGIEGSQVDLSKK